MDSHKEFKVQLLQLQLFIKCLSLFSDYFFFKKALLRGNNLLFLEIFYLAEILEGKMILIYAEKEKLVNMSMTWNLKYKMNQIIANKFNQAFLIFLQLLNNVFIDYIKNLWTTSKSD